MQHPNRGKRENSVTLKSTQPHVPGLGLRQNEVSCAGKGGYDGTLKSGLRPLSEVDENSGALGSGKDFEALDGTESRLVSCLFVRHICGWSADVSERG